MIWEHPRDAEIYNAYEEHPEWTRPMRTVRLHSMDFDSWIAHCEYTLRSFLDRKEERYNIGIHKFNHIYLDLEFHLEECANYRPEGNKTKRKKK